MSDKIKSDLFPDVTLDELQELNEELKEAYPDGVPDTKPQRPEKKKSLTTVYIVIAVGIAVAMLEYFN